MPAHVIRSTLFTSVGVNSLGSLPSETATRILRIVARSMTGLRATSSTPARRSGLSRVHLLSATAFPVKWADRLSHRALRGLLGVSLHAAARRVAEPGSPRLLSGGLHAGPLPGHHASVATEASRQFLGRDLPPLENSRLSRRSSFCTCPLSSRVVSRRLRTSLFAAHQSAVGRCGASPKSVDRAADPKTGTMRRCSVLARRCDAGTNRVNHAHHVDLRQRRCIHLEREPRGCAQHLAMSKDQWSAKSPSIRARAISASRVWKPRFIAAWIRL